MTNAELLSKIKAEIERRKSLLIQHSKLTYDLILETFIKEYDDLLSFLSTLESEKPVPNDLEEAADKYEQEYSDDETLGMAFIAGAKWQKEQDEEEQADLFTIVALDAAQRAKEQMMKDGLDAVKSGQSNKIEKTIAGVFVKYGMDLQKEQMMKEAVEGEYGYFSNASKTILPSEKLNIKEGDKVRIIVLPKKD